jgi:hypothetical protein
MTHEHLSDTDLVMAMDGELPPAKLREVDAHLRACWQCRARRAQFERSVEEFVEWHSALPVPSGDGPRALLKARMAELGRSPRPAAAQARRIAYAGLAAVAGGIAGILIWSISANIATATTPDPNHTPGVTIPVTLKEVCQQQFLDEEQTISPQLARQVFREYGIRNPGAGHYEVDYLITPALGGAEDVRNMWPQPYSTGIWNSHVKDALEDHLRQLVCSGEVSLADAQQELSKDWVAAYQKRFHTSRPLAQHASFVKDKPWG